MLVENLTKVVEFDMCVFQWIYIKITCTKPKFSFVIKVIPNLGNVSQMGYYYPSKPGLLNRSRSFIFFLTFIRETEEKPHHYNSTYPFVSNGISGTH